MTTAPLTQAFARRPGAGSSRNYLGHLFSFLAESDQTAGAFAVIEVTVRQGLEPPPHTHTRRVAERFLKEGRYFMLGSDTHNLAGWPLRFAGLENAIALAGEDEIWRLTRDNPRKLIAGE